MSSKTNYLFFISYSGGGFLTKLRSTKTKKLKHTDPEPVEKFFKRFLESHFKLDVDMKMAVDPIPGTNALFNPVTVRMDWNGERITNTRFYNYFINKQIDRLNRPLKIWNILRMPEKFCAHNSALTCDFLFRFTPKQMPTIFEYPIVTSIKGEFDQSRLAKTLESVNKPFRASPYEHFADEDNFIRRKFKVEPLEFVFMPNSEKFLQSSFNLYDDEIHSVHIKNFPISLAPKIRNVLESLFEADERRLNECVKKRQDDNVVVVDPAKSRLSSLNGLFLTTVGYNPAELDVKKLGFDNEQDE